MVKRLILHRKRHSHLSPLSSHLQAAHSAAVPCPLPSRPGRWDHARSEHLTSRASWKESCKYIPNKKKERRSDNPHAPLQRRTTQTGFAPPIRLNGDNWVLIKQLVFVQNPLQREIPDGSSYLTLFDHYSQQKVIYTPMTDVKIQTPLWRTQGAAL